MRNTTKKTFKIFSMIITAIVVATMFFSVAFISLNAHHECDGENCPICELLQVAESVLSKLQTAVVSVAIVVSLCIFTQQVMIDFSDVITYDSPIRLKVKMLD